jgi:hypothetical protein
LICAPYPCPSASATCVDCAANRGCLSCARCNLPERFAGVVYKRLASRYMGGPSRNWVKTKCPGWKRINAERYHLFEGSPKPELTEAKTTLARKRLELARVTERLWSRPLSHGIARELRKQVTILERRPRILSPS